MELPLLVTLSVNQAKVVPTSSAAQTNSESPLANKGFFGFVHQNILLTSRVYKKFYITYKIIKKHGKRTDMLDRPRKDADAKLSTEFVVDRKNGNRIGFPVFAAMSAFCMERTPFLLHAFRPCCVSPPIFLLSLSVSLGLSDSGKF